MDKANEYQHEWNSTVGAGEVEPSDRTFLAQNSLLGSIPASFGAKAKLQSLHLYQNQINGNICPELG